MCKEAMPYQRKNEENGLNKYLRYLIGWSAYQDNKADVISKYNADKAISLKVYGKLPKHAKINEKDIFGAGDDETIQFADTGDDDKDHDDI